jgi:hypothetical protein
MFDLKRPCVTCPFRNGRGEIIPARAPQNGTILVDRSRRRAVLAPILRLRLSGLTRGDRFSEVAERALRNSISLIPTVLRWAVVSAQ